MNNSTLPRNKHIVLSRRVRLLLNIELIRRPQQHTRMLVGTKQQLIHYRQTLVHRTGWLLQANKKCPSETSIKSRNYMMCIWVDNGGISSIKSLIFSFVSLLSRA